MEQSDSQLNSFEEHVPLKAKIALGFMNAGNGFMSTIGLGSINLFYLKLTGIDPGLMAISWILFALWNAVNDPLLGIIEDRTRSKLGRRVPFLRYGGIFYGIAFILIWFPFTTNAQLLFWNHLLMLFIFDTLFSMIGLIGYSLPSEMAVTAKERANTILISGIIAVIGSIPSFVLPVIYLGNTPDIQGFRGAMIIGACLSALAITCSSYFIKENKFAILEEPLGFLDSLRICLKSRPFLVAVGSVFFLSIMEAILTSYVVFLLDYLYIINLSNIWTWITAGLAVIIVLYPFLKINVIISKYGLKRVMIFGLKGAILGFGIFLVLNLLLRPTAMNKIDFAIIAIPFAFMLLGFLTYMFLAPPVMGEVMDYDEIQTDKRRETTYAGMNALMTKPAISIGHAAFLGILEAFGYINEVDPVTHLTLPPVLQPVSVSLGVIIAFGAVPIGCLLIALSIFRFFPLDGPDWQVQKRNLQKVHEEKERAYIAYIKKLEDETDKT
jgi:GPH family glycoside/pentoside/hexuronide:cation symporter